MTPRIPTPVAGVDVLALPLSTLEGFVLSRVDGRVSVTDIGLMTGVDQERLAVILDRLAELGAVELAWRPKPEKPKAPERPPDAHFPKSRHPQELFAERAEIDEGTRRRILDAYSVMAELDLYALLGVARDAEKRAIRDQYFALSKVFHPDAYFGKDLGSFKQRMEAVFKRLTNAYEVLGKVKKRAEYDQYLVATEHTRKARRTLDSIKITVPQADALASLSRGAAKQAPPLREVKPSSPAPAAEAARPAPSAPSPPPTQPPPGRAAVPPPASLEAESSARAPLRAPASTPERRARIRDRIRRGIRSVVPPPLSEPPPPAEDARPPEQRRRSAIDGLRNSIAASSALSSTKNAQVQSSLKKAANAERNGDVLLAASHLQLALAIDPNDPEVVAEYDRVSKVVARNLADNYEKQALYEEKTGNWSAAARSWMRVSDGRPEDGRAAARGAEALLRAGGDLHEAQRLAQRAVQLDGKDVPRLTILARVYLAAGLKKNALRELQRAHDLAPDDEMVNNLLREAR